METQAEDKVSSQQPDLDKVLEKITEIAEKSADGDYIYRGESAYHQEPPHCGKVSSGLYRESRELEAEQFDVTVVQQELLGQARKYTLHKMDDFEILATLQHYGDNTNLIDFTTDYLVALFFACDGKSQEPGRVILLQRQSKVDPKAYKVQKPPRTIRRAEDQKSIFVQTEKGFVEPNKVVCIPKELKRDMLDYLRKHHNISAKTIYNDLHGFIERRKLHKDAYAAFQKGFTFRHRADSAKTEAERQECYNKAIIHYTEAINLNLEYTSAYNNRGVIYADQGNFDVAIRDYKRAIDLDPEDARAYNNRGLAYYNQGDFKAAIEDYSKAIELAPENARIYTNRGKAWLRLEEWQKARADLTTAKDMDFDIIASFQNDYKSVKDFERKNKVKVPKDIAALLRRK